MRLSALLFSSFVVEVLAQNNSIDQLGLLTTLSQQPQLSIFTSILSQHSRVWNQAILANLTSEFLDFSTFAVLEQVKLIAAPSVLAPSNDAIFDFLSSEGVVRNDTSIIYDAWLAYHILRGTHSKNELQSATQFIPTLLTDPSYSNVTGGQRVEVEAAGSQVYFLSAFKFRSNVVEADIIYAGNDGPGFIHIVDKVLTIPSNFDVTVTEAQLNGVAQALSELPPTTQLAQILFNGSEWTFFAPISSNVPAVLVAGMSSEDIFDWQTYMFVLDEVAYSTDLTDALKLQTLQGSDVTITVLNGTTYVNDVKILKTDYLLAQGVMHVVETALNPNDTTARPSITNSPTPAPIHSSSSLGTGAKAGIGVGAALGAICILCLLIYIFRRRYKGQPSKNRNRPEIPQLDSREKGGLYEVQGKAVYTDPTELSAGARDWASESQRERGDSQSHQGVGSRGTDRSTTVFEMG